MNFILSPHKSISEENSLNACASNSSVSQTCATKQHHS